MGWNYHNKPPLGWPIDWNSNLTKDLIGYWPMNERGGQKVFDLSGYGNIGTFVGTPSWVPGKFGSAIDIPSTGNTDYISVDNAPGFSNEGTLVWWVCLDSFVDYGGHIAAKDSDSNDALIIMSRSTGNISIYQYDTDGNPDINFNTTAVSTGRWMCLACTWSTSNVVSKIYVDGQYKAQDTTLTGTLRAPVKTIVFGTDRGSGGRGLDGKLAGVFGFNRALTASEIAQFYHKPFGIFKDPDEIPLFDQYYTVGNAGVMTLNTKYWGPTY